MRAVWHLARCNGPFTRSGMRLKHMLHATDFLDLRRDGICERMARHAGMQLAVEQRLAVLEERLSALTGDPHVLPYADLSRNAAAPFGPTAPSEAGRQ